MPPWSHKVPSFSPIDPLSLKICPCKVPFGLEMCSLIKIPPPPSSLVLLAPLNMCLLFKQSAEHNGGKEEGEWKKKNEAKEDSRSAGKSWRGFLYFEGEYGIVNHL